MTSAEEVVARTFASPNTWDWSAALREQYRKQARDICAALAAAGYVIVRGDGGQSLTKSLWESSFGK